jgi:Protein of unknown function (DUF998)
VCDTRSPRERGALCPVLHYRADVPGDDEPLNPRGAVTLATSESAARTVLFARLAVVAAVAYQLLLIALIVMRPEIDPARKPISEYAIGRLGWLAVLGFQISAAAYACLVVALRHTLRDRLGRIGMVVLSYCAVATVVVGLCVADPVTTPLTELSAVGRVHVVAGTSAFVFLPVAALMINISLSRTVTWAGNRMLLIVIGLLPSVGFVIFVVLVATVTPSEGWPPRLMFLTYTAWIIAVATKYLWGRSPAVLLYGAIRPPG